LAALRAPGHGARRFSVEGDHPFPVDGDHLLQSMAARARGLWTGVMNAVQKSRTQTELARNSDAAHD
jgi:hypothetical protein